MSLVTRAPTDVVVCARCGPPSPFDEDPGLAAELDEIVAKAEENNEGGGSDMDMEELDEELDVKRYGEEIRGNIAAALLGKRLLPNETPFLAGTVPCDECGGDPKVSRHTPNPQVFLQLEQSFQTDASLRAGDFFWPHRAGFPRAFLGRSEEEEEEAEEKEERERARFFSGHGQPLVFPDRSAGKGKAPMKTGVAAAAAAEKARLRRGRRTHGEAPSRPRMDYFWRDLLASARASPWNAVARVRGGGGEDGPGGWTTSDSEADDVAAAAGDDDDDENNEQEEPELDEDGNPIPKNKNASKKKKKKKKGAVMLSKEEQAEEDARERERRRNKVRKDPPPLTMSELFGDDLAVEYGLAFEDPEAGEAKREGEEGEEGGGGGGGGGDRKEEEGRGGGDSGERGDDDDGDGVGVGVGASDDDDD